MKQTKFSKGDKVFAKVRGYPAWPARIDGAADETPNKVKYHVYFYGTAETGVVKAEDICPYVGNKSKLIKRRKYKNLSEAIIDIEEDMTSEELAELKAVEESGANESTNDDSIQEDKSTKNEDEKESGKIGDKRRQSGNLKAQKGKSAAKSTPNTRKSSPPPQPTQKEKTPPQNTPVKKRKADDQPEKPAKKSKRSTSTVDEVTTSTLPDPPVVVKDKIEEEETPKKTPEKQEAKVVKEPVKKQEKEKEKIVEKPALKTSPEIMSRSGRKIKPKRFDDDETALKSKDKSKEFLYIGKDPNEFKIPLKLNRPIFISSKFASEWDKAVLEHAHSLKTMIEAGDFTESIHDNMEEFTQSLVSDFSKKQDEEQHTHIFNEGRVLDTEMSIKTSLTLDSPDVVKCIKYLDEMDTLPLSALLLKKYPNVVLTIKKVRKYVGNTRKWSMTPEEAEDFNENARIIRSKADHLYNKFKSLFLVPKGQSFYLHFTKEAEAFGRKMQNLSMDEVFTIMED